MRWLLLVYSLLITPYSLAAGQSAPERLDRGRYVARTLEMHLPEQRVRRDGAGVRDERDLARGDVLQQRAQRE